MPFLKDISVLVKRTRVTEKKAFNYQLKSAWLTSCYQPTECFSYPISNKISMFFHYKDDLTAFKQEYESLGGIDKKLLIGFYLGFPPSALKSYEITHKGIGTDNPLIWNDYHRVQIDYYGINFMVMDCFLDDCIQELTEMYGLPFFKSSMIQTMYFKKINDKYVRCKYDELREEL